MSPQVADIPDQKSLQIERRRVLNRMDRLYEIAIWLGIAGGLLLATGIFLVLWTVPGVGVPVMALAILVLMAAIATGMSEVNLSRQSEALFA